MSKFRVFFLILMVTHAVACVFIAHTVQAADRNWTNPAGGGFGVDTNWSDDSVPGVGDKAIFNLDAVFQVTFGDNRTTDHLDVLDGEVTFSLGGNEYTVTNAFELLPTSTRSPSLTVTGGTFEADTWLLEGAASSQPGSLTFSGGTTSGVASGSVLLDPRPSGDRLALTIIGGASVNVASFRYDYDSYVMISGTGSTLEMTGILEQIYGSAVLRVEAGGTLKTSTVWLASRTSDSTAIVTGADSIWEAGAFRFARRPPSSANKNATVIVSAGGTIDSSEAGWMHEESARAQMVVTGAGSSWETGSFYVGGRGHTITARRDQALLLVADGGEVNSARMTLHPEGTLTGNGTVSTTLTEGVRNLGGRIEPGLYAFSHSFTDADGNPETFSQAAAIGTLAINGNLTQVVAVDGPDTFTPTLAFRIADSGQNDSLDVLGDLTLAGILEVHPFGAPLLAANDSFQLFQWSGSLSGTFSEINAFDPGTGLSWDYSNLYVDGTITVIPEPGVFALLMLGGGFWTFVRRRRLT